MMVMSSSSMITSPTGENCIVGSNAVLITENALHLQATLPSIAPNRHICGKTVLWQFFCATPIPRIDVLLCILTGEVHVMARLSQMLGARLAGMVIGHVKTTRLTRIPVGKPLCGV
jgi:hypothetical protein